MASLIEGYPRSPGLFLMGKAEEKDSTSLPIFQKVVMVSLGFFGAAAAIYLTADSQYRELLKEWSVTAFTSLIKAVSITASLVVTVASAVLEVIAFMGDVIVRAIY